MPLSPNEVKNRAYKFANDWKDETRERAEKDTFWNEFFNIFGIDRKRVADFEHRAKRLGNKQGGFIDVFWSGLLLCEHKSKGENLDKAFDQAMGYLSGLKDEELPRYIIVSDFQNIKLKDIQTSKELAIKTAELPNYLDEFKFMGGQISTLHEDQELVNIQAAELMGKIHDDLFAVGYRGHELEIFLVRTLFILFAEDTGIFEKGIFTDYIINRSHEDGSDTGSKMEQIFETLNTKSEDRFTNLDEDLARFSYINGGLFAERIRTPQFDSKMRQTLIKACKFDWSGISPAIFGSLFQYVMDKEKRRNFGAHYTEEQTILKTIKPLFLDDLWAEFKSIKRSKQKLAQFQQKLGKIKFFDPACGCGNFLVITYREIRKLELEIIKILYKNETDALESTLFCQVDVDQFYGIEIEEFPAKIAETALWLTDHIANSELSKELGQYFVRIPLKKHAEIIHGNSLQTDWEEFLPKKDQIYIIGNPPFVGSKFQSPEQRTEMKEIFKGVKGAGVMDYVTAWYIKAGELMNKNPKIETAFVSTNSIVQGEQVGILWGKMFESFGVEIKFAHKSFSWSSEARGKAQVTVIIIGFAKPEQIKLKTLYEYPDIKGEPHAKKVKNINPYLVEADNVVITKRGKPICDVPEIVFGNMPNDGGNFLFTDEEKDEFLKKEPEAKKYFKPLLSAREYLNGHNRWCLWLKDTLPAELKNLPLVMERVENVRQMRAKSSREATRKLADYPTLFGEIRQPEGGKYILIPRVSSEKRNYIPIGIFDFTKIAGDTCLIVPNAELYHFGVLTSKMHMAWVKYTCGRMKSDFRYSNFIVYNNFPWPQNVDEKQKQEIEKLAQEVLDVRAKFEGSSLADLYDPLTMPPELTKAHQKLDKAVDNLYLKNSQFPFAREGVDAEGRRGSFTSDTERVEFLFGLYKGLIK